MSARKRLLAVVCALLLWVGPLEAAVAVVNVYTGQEAADNTLIAPSVVIGASQKALCLISWRANSGITLDIVTFNGSGTGVAALLNNGEDANGLGLSVVLVSGVTGTGDVLATFSTTVLDSKITCLVLSGAGTPGAITVDTPGTGTSTAATPVSGSAGGMFFDMVHVRLPVSGSLVPAGSQTSRSVLETATFHTHGTSTLPGAANANMQWSWTGDALWSHLALHVPSDTAPTTCQGRILLLNMGC